MGRGRRKKKRLGPQQCVLCGKTQLPSSYGCIVGATGRIVCATCLGVSNRMLECNKKPVDEQDSCDRILTPQEILKELDKCIIGQEKAKRAVSIALWKQQLRANGEDVPRTNLLLYGPTGCGKTALVQEAAKIVGLPYIVYDATTLSEAGYRGNDAQDMITTLQSRYNGHPKLKYGVVFLDEVDKLAGHGSEVRTAYSRGTQHTLLKLVEGMDITTDQGIVSTGDLLFIFGGAFIGIRKQKEKALPHISPIGFVREQETQVQQEESTVTTEDFVRYGMEAELMGRVGQQIPLEALGADDLKKILSDSRLSLYRQYQRFFLQHGVQLEFTSAKVDDLVDQALALGTGARALNALVEESVEPLLLRLAAGELQEKEKVRHAG